MKKIKKWLALLMVTVGILSTGTMTAFAYVDESAQTEAVPERDAAPDGSNAVFCAGKRAACR